MDPISISCLLTKKLKLKITRRSLGMYLSGHPDYPSLLSISDVLNLYRIRNVSVRIKGNELKKVILPAIAHMANEEEGFVLLEEANGSHVKYIATGGSRVLERISEFEKRWTGVVLMAEPGPDSRENNYDQLHQVELVDRYRWPFLCSIATLIVLGGAIFFKDSCHLLSLYFIFVLGTCNASLLVAKEWGIEMGYLGRLCAINRKFDCQGVLNSHVSTIWGGIKLSHLAFVFFAGEFSAFFLAGLSGDAARMIDLLGVLSMVAAAVVLFPLYFQVFVIRKYCLYCLALLLLTWVQSFLLARGSLFLTIGHVAPHDLFMFLTGYGIAVLFLVFFQYMARGRAVLRTDSYHFRNIKKSAGVLSALLQCGKPVELERLKQEIILGPTDPKYLLTIVLNLNCSGCSDTFQKAEFLLLKHPGKVAILIRYSADMKNELDRNTLASDHLLRVSGAGTAGRYLAAIRYWFRTGDYEALKERFPLDDREGIFELLRRQNHWIARQDIQHTPSIFINERMSPEGMSIEDIDILIKHDL